MDIDLSRLAGDDEEALVQLPRRRREQPAADPVDGSWPPQPDPEDAGSAAAPSPEPRTDDSAPDPFHAAEPPSDERAGHEPDTPEPAAAEESSGGFPMVEAPTTDLAAVREEDFTEEQFVRHPPVTAQTGWRRWVRDLSGGAVALAPGKAEVSRQATLARVRAPVDGCRRIAVLSRKGGVGKTSVTLGLGHTFATIRPDRIVAIDANPDAGTLGYRIEGSTRMTITDLLRDAEAIERYSDVRRYTALAPSRLEVLASDDDPRITQAVGELEYEAAVDVLERHYNLILTDTGTDITHSVMQGILGASDQVVVVAAPSLDGARAASKTFDWMEQNGHGYLVRGAVVAVNGVRRRTLVDLQRIVDHFGGRCRAVIALPWDRHLEAGAQTSLEDLHPSTRSAYVELAAAIADGFGPTLR